MGLQGTKERSFLVFASFVALLAMMSVAWRSVAVPVCDASDEYAQESVINLSLAVPSLAAPRGLPQQRTEIVPAAVLSRRALPTLHYATSRGVPVESARHLLAFLQTCRT
jgi:hypothetical protein